jgi:hypothetical protein
MIRALPGAHGWLIQTIAESKVPAQRIVDLALTEPIRTRTAP